MCLYKNWLSFVLAPEFKIGQIHTATSTGGGVWTKSVNDMVEGVHEWGLGGPAALDLLTIFWLVVVLTKVPIRLFYDRFLKLLPYYDSK